MEMLSAPSGPNKSRSGKAVCHVTAAVVEGSNCMDLTCPSADVVITIPPCVNCFQAAVELRLDCPTCLCKGIQKTCCLPDLACIKSLFAHHTTTRWDQTPSGPTIIAGYNITIQYIDCRGTAKTVTIKDKVVFENFPCGFSAEHFTLFFKNASCDYNACGVLTACFTAELCSCAKHDSLSAPK